MSSYLCDVESVTHNSSAATLVLFINIEFVAALIIPLTTPIRKYPSGLSPTAFSTIDLYQNIDVPYKFINTPHQKNILRDINIVVVERSININDSPVLIHSSYTFTEYETVNKAVYTTHLLVLARREKYRY